MSSQDNVEQLVQEDEVKRNELQQAISVDDTSVATEDLHVAKIKYLHDRLKEKDVALEASVNENLELRVQLEALQTSQNAQAVASVERQLFEVQRKLEFAQHNSDTQLAMQQEARSKERSRLQTTIDVKNAKITELSQDIRKFQSLLKHITVHQYAKMYRAKQACTRVLIRVEQMNKFVTEELVDHQDRPGGAAYANAFELDSLRTWMKAESERFQAKREKKQEANNRVKAEPSGRSVRGLKLSSMPLHKLLKKLEEGLGMQDLNVKELGERVDHWHETSNSFLERQMELLNDTRKKGGQLRQCMQQIDELEAKLEKETQDSVKNHSTWQKEFNTAEDAYFKAQYKLDEQAGLLERKTRMIATLETKTHEYEEIIKALQGYIGSVELAKRGGKRTVKKKKPHRPTSSSRKGSMASARKSITKKNKKPPKSMTATPEVAAKILSLPYLKDYVNKLGEDFETLNPNRPVWRKGGLFDSLNVKKPGSQPKNTEGDPMADTRVHVRPRIDGRGPNAGKKEESVAKKIYSLKGDASRPEGIYPTVDVIVPALASTSRQNRISPPKRTAVYSLRRTAPAKTS